jgi:hypothetical protein
LDSEVTILDGGACNFGIESTVLKIVELPDAYELLILRKGGVSEKALQDAIKSSDFTQGLKISVTSKKHTDFKKETENLEGPG